MIKQSAKTSSRDYILVDLRRNDYEVTLITNLQFPHHRTNELGWHHSRFDQSSCAESVPYHGHPIHGLQRRRPAQNNMVLLYVFSARF